VPNAGQDVGLDARNELPGAVDGLVGVEWRLLVSQFGDGLGAKVLR
jgi:hypothetical protein